MYILWLLAAIDVAQCIRVGGATACVGKDEQLLGEVACQAPVHKLIIAETGCVAEVTREAAGEFIDACFKAYGEDKVYKVGRRLYEADQDFLPYTVLKGPALDNPKALQRFKPPPPPPPKPKPKPKPSSQAGVQASMSRCIVIASVWILLKLL